MTGAGVLGIAASALARSTRSAGVAFIEFGSVAPWMRDESASGVPAAMGCDRDAVGVPPDRVGAVCEPGGSYQLGIGAVAVIAWVLIGFVVAVRTLRFGAER